MDVSFYPRVIVLVFLIGLSALFSGSETGIFSLNRLHLDGLAEKGHKRLPVINALLSNPRRTLVTILLGNEVVNISIAALVGSLGLILGMNRWLSIVVATGVLLLFGEVTPKSLALRHPVRYAVVVAPIIHTISRIVAPLRILIEWFLEGLNRIMGPGQAKRSEAILEDEFRMLVDVGLEEGELKRFESEMIRGVLDLEEITVGQIMTPRTEIHALPAGLTLAQAAERLKDVPYSRIPVVGENMDDIRGILYMNDLVKSHVEGNEAAPLKTILHPPYFVPEQKRAQDLFREFRSRKQHIAVVVDEYGGISGMVSMDDILEELVGEIQQEDKADQWEYEVIEDGSTLVSARMRLEDFNRLVGANLSSEEHGTLGGLLFTLFGHLPEQGERIEYGGFEFKVIEVRQTRIMKIHVSRKEGGQ